MPEPVVEPTPIVWRQEPGPALAVMRDGSVVQVPEPAAEAVEKIDTPPGPATPGFVEYWHGRDGWRWYMVVLDHQGGPFPTFDEAVADRWRYA